MNGIPQLAGLLRPKDIKPETSFDIILKHWLEHRVEQLPEDLANMLKRWEKANQLIRDGYLVTKGQNEITQPYTFQKLADYLVQEYNVSFRTAYDDIANAKKFFLSTYKRDDKEFARGIMIEWGQRFMFEAQSLGDFKSSAAFFKALAEIQGLTKDDPDLPDYTQIQLPTLVLVADPSELGFEKIDNVDAAVKAVLAKRKKSKLDQLIADSDVANIIEEDGN